MTKNLCDKLLRPRIAFLLGEKPLFHEACERFFLVIFQVERRWNLQKNRGGCFTFSRMCRRWAVATCWLNKERTWPARLNEKWCGSSADDFHSMTDPVWAWLCRYPNLKQAGETGFISKVTSTKIRVFAWNHSLVEQKWKCSRMGWNCNLTKWCWIISYGIWLMSELENLKILSWRSVCSRMLHQRVPE